MDFSKRFLGNVGVRPSTDSRDENKETARPVERIDINPNLFSEIANAVWKAKQKLLSAGKGEFQGEIRSIFRYIDSISDALTEAGIQIQDHTNEPFDSGQSLEVLAFQPTTGISRDTVVETIRPSVYLMGRRIQMGQVIVASPEPKSKGVDLL